MKTKLKTMTRIKLKNFKINRHVFRFKFPILTLPKTRIFQIAKYFAILLSFNLLALVIIPTSLSALFDNKHINQTTPSNIAIPKEISIYRTTTDAVETIKFEDYIKGVVSCEMPSSFEKEALKAQSVAARTYSLSKIIRSGDTGFPEAHPTAAICDSTHCQVYKSPSELENIKGTEWMNSGYKKICSAVDSTKGKVMIYNGNLVEQALFHSSSGGATENSEDVFASAVPYLRSVESPYEDEATHQDEETTLSLSALENALNQKFPNKRPGTISSKNTKIISKTDGGRVDSIKIGNATYTGREIREILNLSSANFTITISNNLITFTNNGYGHGVGMSQYGANGMAKKNYSYKAILKHYYQGIDIL